MAEPSAAISLGIDEDEILSAEYMPDIHTLFRTYNTQYFEGFLDGCLLEWSGRMTLCAGICYSKRSAGGGARQCTIRLSRPLLQYRPFTDIIDTLLHEMIHAYIFMKFGGSLQRDGHGPDFQAVQRRINAAAGTKISIYHTFHDEVRACRKHKWRCLGPCQDWAPFFGYCSRSMNRPPQPADQWWAEHQRKCGGTFVKIAGETTEDGKKKRRNEDAGGPPPISAYFKKFKTPGQVLGSSALPTTNETKVISPVEEIFLSDFCSSPKYEVDNSNITLVRTTIPASSDVIDLTSD